MCSKNPVSLRFVSNKGHFCAGTILNSKWILTAAHCFTFIKSPDKILVQYNSTELNPSQPQYAPVLDVIKHEGYNPTIAIHDIALIKLRNGISLATDLKEVKLGNNNSSRYENLNTNLLGWGLNETFGTLAANLQRVTLNTLTLENCRSQLKSIVHMSNLCAGGDHKGQCSGDSGGPLLFEDKQIGLVSWSFKPCGIKPGIFTNTAYYIDWIKKIIEK